MNRYQRDHKELVKFVSVSENEIRRYQVTQSDQSDPLHILIL
jgi:hypothetical protein